MIPRRALLAAPALLALPVRAQPRFPDKPITKKPAETRQGTGKGGVEYYVAVVKPGRTLFELSYPNEELAKEALNKAIAMRGVTPGLIHHSDRGSQYCAYAYQAKLREQGIACAQFRCAGCGAVSARRAGSGSRCGRPRRAGATA